MRRRLIASVMLLAAFAANAKMTIESEQDLAVGRFIFQLMDALQVVPQTDQQLKSTLGSAVEFAFLQLQRSQSAGSVQALAETIVLDIDAGAGTSQQDAILAKPTIVISAMRRALESYDQLCSKRSTICADRDAVKKRVSSLAAAIYVRDGNATRNKNKKG